MGREEITRMRRAGRRGLKKTDSDGSLEILLG